MDEVHYLISDASKKVDVEAHVLRYWEEELELDIPRNEMGHRYYTDLHIRLFKQVKNLKEKGYQLKAIKHALNQVLKKDGKAQGELSDEILERDMSAALKEFKEEDSATSLSTVKGDGVSVVAMEEKMEQFQQIMNLIIGRALEVNNEKLSQDISCLVNGEDGQGTGVFVPGFGPEGGGTVPPAGRDAQKLPEGRTGRGGSGQGSLF